MKCIVAYTFLSYTHKSNMLANQIGISAYINPDNKIFTECAKCGHKLYVNRTSEKDDLNLLIAQKDSEILRLKAEIESLKQESEVMVESFRISSDMLLERLKDLESVNFAGERPQTAQVLGRIHGDRSDQLRRPAIMNDFRAPDILNLEQEQEEELSEENVCPNCREMVRPKEFAMHTIQ